MQDVFIAPQREYSKELSKMVYLKHRCFLSSEDDLLKSDSFWMYPLERFNSWLSQRVLSKRYPESTVLETYKLFEVTFLPIVQTASYWSNR